MKIIILLFASFFSIGFAYTEAVRETTPEAIDIVEKEQPVLHVMLDTVDVVAVSPAALTAIK